ncbi:MAG: hypothetical protein R3B84_04455 [Zavarzinella sp.]
MSNLTPTDRLAQNIRNAETIDLLDRITAYRLGLEPLAVELIHVELYRRGVSASEIVEHEEKMSNLILDRTGVARQCARCHRPASQSNWALAQTVWYRAIILTPVISL